MIAIALLASPSSAIPMIREYEFFIDSMMIPFLVFALAAIGLNILTGYTGSDCLLERVHSWVWAPMPATR